MMMNRLLVIVLGLLCCLSFNAIAAKTIYVAPTGNDAWSGALEKANAEQSDGPLATLVAARDAIRTLKGEGALPKGGVTVLIQEGIYCLQESFALGQEDSASPQAPISYQAAPGATVRLVGGVVVEDFEPVSDAAALSRLDDAIEDKVMQADLSALGVSDFGSPGGGGMELFFQDRPMTLSRWPNDDFVRIVDVCDYDGHEIHGKKGSKTGKFIYDGDRPARWVGEKDGWLLGYWFWDWSEERKPIAAIDTEAKTISLADPAHNYGYRKGQWYYAFNLLSEVDQPGEWYVDREAGILYFYPPAPLSEGKVLLSVLKKAITLDKVSNTTLRGLTIEAVRSTAIAMHEGSQNRILGCTIRNGGSEAISVSGGAKNGVIGCDIYNMGGGGISLNGGDRLTLTPAGHFAENNHVHHYGRWYRMYRKAVALGGVGNRASHNLIHDAPHMAIGFSGNDHLIEFNEIHSVCFESNDAGAIYAGRDWTMRGNTVRFNYFHHIQGFEAKGCVGVYLDDMFSSADIESNVFYKVTRAAFIGGGRDCSVVNNLFIDCRPALHIDSRALGWAHYHADEWIAEAKEKNTVKGVRFTEPPYSTRYPQLLSLIEDEPKAPKGNRVARNICVGGTWDGVDKKARPYIQFKDNHITRDDLFEDKEGLDFRFRKDIDLPDIGFSPIPIEGIGLYDDEYRASWPAEHQVRPNERPKKK